MSKKAKVSAVVSDQVSAGRGRPKGSTNRARALSVGLTGYQADIDALVAAVKKAVSGPVTVTELNETASGKTFTIKSADGSESKADASTVLFRDQAAVVKAVFAKLS